MDSPESILFSTTPALQFQLSLVVTIKRDTEKARIDVAANITYSTTHFFLKWESIQPSFNTWTVNKTKFPQIQNLLDVSSTGLPSASEAPANCFTLWPEIVPVIVTYRAAHRLFEQKQNKLWRFTNPLNHSTIANFPANSVNPSQVLSNVRDISYIIHHPHEVRTNFMTLSNEGLTSL